MINVLSSDIYNKIAAGEVVERPASVVKELVENSIDAGASQIVVSVANGGLDKIEVFDDGKGISVDEVETAFLPHATSKIKDATDLEEIKTLGFRGEALASISAVSYVTITTQTSDEELGVSIEFQAGNVVSKTLLNANVGTKICVSHLFYNVPARKKFLKSASREGAEIGNYITKLIFANPTLKIKYVVDGVTQYDFHGKGCEEAIFEIYGSDCLAQCLSCDATLKDVHISGLISKPQYFKPNSSYQTIVVNGRFVNNSVITGAIKNAYKAYLMLRQFPVFVLYINHPESKVDVNVHPSKLEVRFEDSQSVYLSAYLTVKDTLNRCCREAIDQIIQQQENEEKVASTTSTEQTLPEINKEQKTTFEQQYFAQLPQMQEKEQLIDTVKSIRNNIAYAQSNVEVTKNILTENLLDKAYERESNPDSLNVEQPQAHLSKPEAQKIHQVFSTSRFVGILFDTYIVLERGDFVFIVDQHAAHERILYDKYVKQCENGNVVTQDLLVPYLFDVTDNEAVYLHQNMDNLQKGGFEIEAFGQRTFKLNTVPLTFAGMDEKRFIRTVLEGIQYFDMSLSTLNFDLLARRACRTAVKGGDVLSRTEVFTLLQELDEKPVLKCPHGRPIVVIYGKVDFEKWFKRILT